MNLNRSRIFVASALVAGGGMLMVPTVASAHANAVTCVDQATSTWRIQNDHPLSETFTSTEGPSGSVAAGAGSFTDVVWNGDSLHVTGTWTDGYVGSTTGSGDCSPEIIVTTTTEATTSTTTTEPTTTTSTTSIPGSTTASTSSTTSTTTTSDTPSTTTLPSSGPSSTLPPPSSTPTTPPPTSTPSVPPTSTPRPCTAGPSTPEPSLPGTPSAPPCGRLPTTGNPDLGILTVIAAASIMAGAFMLTKTRR